jgi:glucokinase
VLHREARGTPADEGPSAVIAVMVQEIRDVLGLASAYGTVRGMGVAAPGPLDPWTGVVHFAPNLPGWREVPLKRTLEDAVGLPATVGNDANLAVLGEALFGAGRGHANLIYLTVSTGVGSGILVDGRLLVGARGLAAEAGHVVVQLDGPACACGNRGCLESVASGTAIAARAAERLAGGEPSSLRQEMGEISAEHVANAADAGDALARSVLTDAARAMGVGIASLVHLFNPSLVALGGGVTRSGELWWTTLLESVRRATLPGFERGLEIVPTQLGDDVGLLGAAAAVFGSGPNGRA